MVPPKGEKAVDREQESAKKPRRSQRLSQSQKETEAVKAPVSKKQYLPSPITHQESTSSSDAYKETTASPEGGRPSQLQHRSPPHDTHGFSSPPQDTQAFSQFIYPTTALSDEVKDEAEEGVWGYLLPLDQTYGKSLVLRRRNACPLPAGMKDFGKFSGDRLSKDGKSKDFVKEAQAYDETKLAGIASGGYLIGRHPECGMLVKIKCGDLH